MSGMGLIRFKPCQVFLLFAVVLVFSVSAKATGESEDWQWLLERAIILCNSGRYNEAKPLLVKAVSLAEDDFGADSVEFAKLIVVVAGQHTFYGSYPSAVTLYRQALEIFDSNQGSDLRDVAEVLTHLGIVYLHQACFKMSEPLLRRALEIREKALGPDHPDLAESMMALAQLFSSLGKYVAAEPLLEHSLAIMEKTPGPGHLNEATALKSLAGLYKAKGNYPAAESLYRRSLEISEKALGPDHPIVATAQNGLGGLYQNQSQYVDAELLYRQSLKTYEKALGPEHPNVAQSLSNLTSLFQAQGKYAAAETLCERSIDIREMALGRDHPDLAQSLNNLASLYQAQSKYAAADSLFERSLDILEKALGPVHPDVALALNNLAGLYKAKGKYCVADSLFERSLEIREMALGSDHPDVANSLNNLAQINQLMGNYEAAELLGERSLETFENALGPDHQFVAIALNSIAVVYWAQGNYSAAEPLLVQSLEVLLKALGQEHLDVAKATSNLANIYKVQGDYVAAEPLFKHSLEIHEKALGADHPDVATALNNLALLYHAQGDYVAAEPLYKHSLEIRGKALGPAHPSLVSSRNNLAMLFNAQGRYPEAEPLLFVGIKNIRNQANRYFSHQSERERVLFLDSVDGAIFNYYSFGQRYADSIPSLTAKVLDTTLWSKGLLLSRHEAERRAMMNSSDPVILRLYQDLQAKRQQICSLVYSPSGDREYPRQYIDQLEAEANDLEKKLARRSEVYSNLLETQNLGWADIRDRLAPGDVAVQFLQFPYFDGQEWTGEHHLLAFIILPGIDSPSIVNLGTKEALTGSLKKFQSVFSKNRTGNDNLMEDCHPLWQSIWQPLEPHVGHAGRLYISLDGDLNLINFGLMVDAEGGYLMDRYDLRYVNSLLDLLEEKKTSFNQRALMVGDPDFDLDIAGREETFQVVSANWQGSTDPVRGSLNPQWGRLGATKVEVEVLASQLRGSGWEVNDFVEEQATEEVLKLASEGSQVLHLATHGYFLEDLVPGKTSGVLLGERAHVDMRRDPLLRSGLVFAGANVSDRAAGVDDGYLTAYEAQYLDLSETELVVLSACETGMGTVSVGEGVYGLRRAFAVAGAGGVLMSLCEVPDQETKELMEKFYGHWLEGDSPNEALRKAQMEQREEVISRMGADLPLYWGAFIYVKN